MAPELTKWDPQLTEKVKNVVGPIIKRWFRSEVRGLDAFPVLVERWWCRTTPAGC